MTVIDVDDSTTWPRLLIDAVSDVAEGLRGTTEYTLDLRPSTEALSMIREVLGEVRVTVFHATRLLPREIEHVRATGLEFASRTLFERKVQIAVDDGQLTPHDASQVLATTMALDGTDGVRAAQVCAIAGTSVFRNDLPDVLPLLDSWGGEVIYFAHERDALGARLRTIGRPTIVQLTAPAVAVHDLWFPDIELCLIGSALGLTDVGSNVFIKTDPVTASAITAIHSPGSTWWARFPRLPTA